MFTSEQVVRALYLGVLGREPDPGGLAAYMARLHQDASALDEIAASFHRSEEHVRNLAGASMIPDHSQYGEFLSLDIEGLDIAVLNDLLTTTDYRPGLISIEASMNFANRSLDDIAVDDIARKEYRLAFQTVSNMILARK